MLMIREDVRRPFFPGHGHYQRRWNQTIKCRSARALVFIISSTRRPNVEVVTNREDITRAGEDLSIDEDNASQMAEDDPQSSSAQPAHLNTRTARNLHQQL